MMHRSLPLLFIAGLRRCAIEHHQRRCSSTTSHLAAKSIMIFASEVPVIAKLNKYRNVEDVFYTVWDRTDHEQVKAVENEFLLPTPQEQLENLIVEAGASEARKRALEQSSTIDSGSELNKVTQVLAQDIASLPNVEDKVKKDLIQHVTSEVQQGYGARNEAKAIKHYEAKRNVKVSNSNLKFYKKSIGSINDTQIFVGGRIDGEAGGRVIEVKNRMKRFMNPLPRYDLAQLQTYLYILDSPEGELVEHLRSKGNKGGGLQTHTTIVPRDEQMWETQILPHLLKFANSLVLFMDDTEQQRKFLSEDEKGKRKIIGSY